MGIEGRRVLELNAMAEFPQRRRRIGRAWWWVVGALLFAGAAALVLVSYREARSQIEPDRRAIGSPPEDLKVWLETVSLQTADGLQLRGWFGTGRGSAAVVLLHAYGGDRRSMLDRARLFRDAGYAVLLYDARASGESEGELRSIGYHEVEDLLAATKFLGDRGVQRIACVGWSQGGSTILMAAERLPPSVRCVVLESAFDSLDHSIDRAFRKRVSLPGVVAGIFYQPIFEFLLDLHAEDFRPIDHAPHLPCPVLVMSGSDDRSTWSSDTRALFDAASEPKELWLVMGAEHENLCHFAPREYSRRVLGFLQTWLD